MKRQIKFLIILLLFQLKGISQYKQHLKFHKAEVFKDDKKKIFKITSDGKVIYDHLKFVDYAEGALQVLTNKNELIYIDKELNKTSFPEEIEEYYCGTVDDYFVEIIEKEKHFLVEKTINFIDSKKATKKVIIHSVPKENIKEISFLTKEKRIRYDENSFFPETLLIETKDGEKGVKANGETTEYYDEIKVTNFIHVKVKKNNLWGYYNTTDIKYKKLDKYIFNLASFELQNGKKGFIDSSGNEYLE